MLDQDLRVGVGAETYKMTSEALALQRAVDNMDPRLYLSNFRAISFETIA